MPKITRLPAEDYRDGVFSRGYVVEDGTKRRYKVTPESKIYVLNHVRRTTDMWPKRASEVTGINVHFLLNEGGVAYKLVAAV